MIERRVRIIQDSDPCDPRTKWYCMPSGRMLCWHNRYNLGDDHSYDSTDWKRELACEADSGLKEKLEKLKNNAWPAIVRWLQDEDGYDFNDASFRADAGIGERRKTLIDRAFDAGYVALPLYLYDHSGLNMSTSSFGCMWDSGQVGWIVCDQKTIDKNFNSCRDKAEDALRSEVEVYNDYLTGNVWGYICEERESEGCNACNRPHDWEQVDSCWGFFGDPKCIKDEMTNDFVDAFEAAIIEHN